MIRNFKFLDIFLFIDLFRKNIMHILAILCTDIFIIVQTHALDTIASLNGSSGKRIVTK